VAVAAVALSACGDSPEDQARDDGKDVGEAVRQLADATSIDDARAAVEDLRGAVDGLDSDTRERVQKQVETQRDTVSDAVDSAAQAGSFEDARTALADGAQQLRSQADSFQSTNNSVTNEFWRGFEEGYDGD
jgi:hypothetical protein